MANKPQDPPLVIATEWRKQADRDLEVAKHLKGAGYSEWACYAAQQAAEKAVKALRLCLGAQEDDLERWSHNFEKVLGTIPSLLPTPDPALALAPVLFGGRYWSDTRYPSRNRPGPDYRAPCDTFLGPAADEAVETAEKLVDLCRRLCERMEMVWRTPS